MVRKIISGGSPGSERAALDAASKNGYQIGGWCVKGKVYTNGAVPSKYILKETMSTDPLQKTELNIRDANGTIIFYNGKSNAFTHLVNEYAVKYQKPYLLVNLSNDQADDLYVIKIWIDANKIRTLNVTSELSEHPDIDYKQSLSILHQVLKDLKIDDEEDYND